MTILLWLANLALDTAGQMAFKAGAARTTRPGVAGLFDSATHPLVVAGSVCYCVEFVTWLAFLTLVPLSVAVLLASINIVTVSIAGRLLFNESASVLRVAGIALIAAGVATVGWGSA